MQKITPFLWFDGKAEEAASFYTSIFKNSKILNIARNGDAGPGPKGSVMMVAFQLEGQNFMALNGGPIYNLYSGHIVICKLRNASGGIRVMGQAHCRGLRGAVRMAERQIRPLVANYPERFDGTDAGQRPCEIAKSLQSHAANDQD